MNDMMADTAFIFARYGEETNMDRKTVYDYSLQCHYLWKDLVNGTTEYLEDLTMSHTSLAQGYLLRDKPDKAVEHCQESIRIRAEFRNDGSICELAHILQAWGMCGLGNYDQAALLCEAVIQYRAERFGPEDRSSIKYAQLPPSLTASQVVKETDSHFYHQTRPSSTMSRCHTRKAGAPRRSI